MLAPIFVVNKFKLPLCHFRITADGITRESGGTPKQVAWREVERIKVHSPGFLLCMAKGGMPLPFRCLKAGQRSELEKLFAVHGLPPV